MDAIVKAIMKVIEIFIDALFSDTTTVYIKNVIKVTGFLFCTIATIVLLTIPFRNGTPSLLKVAVQYTFALLPAASVFWLMYFSWLEKNR